MIYVASTIKGPKYSAYIGVFETRKELEDFARVQTVKVAYSEHESLESANKFMQELIKMTPWYKDWNK